LFPRVAVSPVCDADKTAFPSDTWERAQGLWTLVRLDAS